VAALEVALVAMMFTIFVAIADLLLR